MRSRHLLVPLAALTLTLAVTHPAMAEETTATVTITGGTLSITAPGDAGSLDAQGNAAQGGTISGSLGQVQVNDARGAAAGSGWVASVISTEFTPLTGGPAIPASAVGYTAGQITKVGTATFTPNNPGNISALVPAVTATEITGDNSATWNPTIHVTLPDGMAAGVYSAIITHSVL